MRNKNILISAFVGSKNLGDEAIFESYINSLGDYKSQITVFSINPSETFRKYNVKSVKPSLINIIKAIKSTDVLLVGGGGILQDKTSIYNLIYFTLQIILANFFGKKVAYIGIGAGPVESKIGRFFLRKSLKNIDLVTVRDEKAYEIINKYSPDQLDIKLYADPAINLSYQDEEAFVEKFGLPEEFIAVSVRQWNFHNKYIPVKIMHKFRDLLGISEQNDDLSKSVAKVLDEVIEETGKKVVFIPLYDQRDIKASKNVIKYMDMAQKTIVVEEKLDVKKLFLLLQKSKYTIGMRLHSVILSAAAYTPMIALSYSSKVRYFMKHLGMDNYVIDTDNLNKKDFLTKFKKLIKDEDKINQNIRKSVQNLKEKHNKNIQTIKQFIES